MLISFVFSMLTVVHIFEIPFMVYDPSSFQKPNSSFGNVSLGNDSSFSNGSLGNAAAYQSGFSVKDSNETVENYKVIDKLESFGNFSVKDFEQKVNSSSNSTFHKIMIRILKNDLGLTNEPKSQGPFSQIIR
jgi:hypothetical protein